MHRFTTRLVADGLLELADDPADAKKRRLSLMTIATLLLRRADRRVIAFGKRMIEGIDPAELERIGRHVDDCKLQLQSEP